MPSVTSPAPAISILACGGGLPLEIAEILKAKGRDVNIVSIAGMADADYTGFELTSVSIGRIGALIKALRKDGIREMIIAGHARRPDLRSLNIDAGFVRNLPTILGLMRGGDDQVLRQIAGFFERNGLSVKSIEEVAPELLTPSGPLNRQPTPAAERGARRGLALIHRLGSFDVGQAVILDDDRVIAIEGAEGTNGLMSRTTVTKHRQQDQRPDTHPDTQPSQPDTGKSRQARPGSANGPADHRHGNNHARRSLRHHHHCTRKPGQSLIVARSQTIAEADQHGIAVLGLSQPPPYPSPLAQKRRHTNQPLPQSRSCSPTLNLPAMP